MRCWIWIFLILIRVAWAEPVSLEKIGELQFGGEFVRCRTVGERLYLTDRLGLQIYDISNPARPNKLGAISLPGNSERLVVAGNYAYVSSFRTGVQIVDIGDPMHPRRVHEINLNLQHGTVESLQKMGNRLYIHATTQLPPYTQAHFIYVVDITYPPHATLINAIQHNGQSVRVMGHFLYLLRANKLIVLDISAPTWPRVTFMTSLSKESTGFRHLLQAGIYILVVGGSEGVSVWSLEDTARPRQIGVLGQSITGVHSAWEVDTLAVYDPEQGILLIDLSDLEKPRQVGYIQTKHVWGMTLTDGWLYFTDSSRRVQVWDVSDPAQPVQIGLIPGAQSVLRDVVVWGRYAYVTNLREGLLVLDVRAPEDPKQVAILPFAFEPPYYGAFKLAMQPPLIYMTYSRFLVVIDVSQSTQPQMLAKLPLGEIAQGIDLSDNYAYIGLENGKLVIVDISQPKSPKIDEIIFPGPGRIRDVKARGQYIYLAREDRGLTIFERIRHGDPPQIHRIGELDTSGLTESVALYGNKVLLANAYSGLTVVDISQIDSPAVLAMKPGGSRENTVTVIGSYAILGTEQTTQVWNLRSSDFSRLTSVDVPDTVLGVHAQGNWVFVAASSTFEIFRLRTDLLVDVNDDGLTTSLDAQAILEYRIKGSSFIGNPVDADLNSDGKLTAYDAALLLNARDSEHPLAWEWGEAKMQWQQKKHSGRTTKVFIAITDVPVWSAEWSVRYPSSRIRLLPTSVKWQLPKDAVAVHLLRKGKLTLAFASSVPISEKTPLVQFAVKGTSGGRNILSVEAVNVNDDTLPVRAETFTVSFEPAPSFALPRPFPNPSRKVWIPFVLPEEADVFVCIYTLDGRLVHKLKAPKQQPGPHVAPANALFWNGQNLLGERVAEGIYFYELKAGEHRATQRVVIQY